MRTAASLVALVALSLAACGSSPSVSTPVISALALGPTATPGGTETGMFLLMNASGVTGLSIHVTLTDSMGGSSPVEVEPLQVSGADQDTANAEVMVAIPSNAPAGTYTLSVTVSDGDDTSNELTGTFDVS